MIKAVFISNYINHHQIPFSDALYERLGEGYHFIQTEPMEEERVKMGWALDAAQIPYVVLAYEEEARCRRLIEEADLVLAGWTERTDLFLPRLSAGKLTLRISERIYREGQWKALSPRGLLAKYREHVRFRKKPAYLLCAGAYVSSDFSLIGAYPGRQLKFGYFPPLRRYDMDALFEKKRRAACAANAEGKMPRGGREACMQIVWAGRMIPLKHPEFVVRLAKELAVEKKSFHIHMIGSGPMEEDLHAEAERSGLLSQFTFYGFLPPERVRDIMEACQLMLFTSNYLEGWGSVVNEAMNSGCCVVANVQTGAALFLIEDGKNGMLYRRTYEEFATRVKALFADPARAEALGRAACETILSEWNAEHAAEECLRFYQSWKKGAPDLPATGPFSRAPRLCARWRYDEGRL